MGVTHRSSNAEMSSCMRSVSETRPHRPIIIDVHAAVDNVLRNRVELSLVEDASQAAVAGAGEFGRQVQFQIGKCSIHDTIVLVGVAGAKASGYARIPYTCVLKRA